MKPINEKMKNRMLNMKKAFDLSEPEKVPVNLQTTTWSYAYAKVTQAEVLNDPLKNAQAYTKVYDDIEVDLSTFGINVMPIRVFEALKSDHYVLAKDDTAIVHSQAKEDYFPAEVYDLLSKGNSVETIGKLIDEITRRIYPALFETKEKGVQLLKEAIPPFLNSVQMKQTADAHITELGIPIIFNAFTFESDAPFFFSPFTMLMDQYRGMSGALTDLRRRPQQVKEMCDAIHEHNKQTQNFMTDVEEIKKKYAETPVPFGLNILNAECFIPTKFFEDYYMKYFKEIYIPYIEAGAKIYILGEGKLTHTYDFYNDLPKSSLLIHTDEDDPFEVYAKIKDRHTLCTGPSLSLLKYGTKEDCIDYTKKCIDTFAPGGGYLFMHNKTLTAARDVNCDNLKATYDFANEYGRK